MPNLQLSKNLFTLRKSKSLTQKELSTFLNISRQAYSNYETSKRTPDLDSLIALSQLYHVSLDQLINHSLLSQISETSGPYRLGIDITSGDTLYLSEEETDLIMNYREMNIDNRKIIKGFFGYHTQQSDTKK